MEPTFQLNRRTFPHGVILDLSGDITKTSEEAIQRAMDWEGTEQDQRSSYAYLVLNFTQVPYMNSAGIALLIRLSRSSKKAGIHTLAFGLSSHYQKLFRMVGLTESIMLLPDEHAVLRRVEELEKLD